MPISYPHLFHAKLAGDIGVNYAFEFEETAHYMEAYLEKDAAVVCHGPFIHVGESEYADWMALGNSSRSAYAEYSLLSCRTSEYLVAYNRMVFHSVAIRSQGRAWLITAPPGIGKSTQYKNLQELHPEEVGIICGDRPILEMCKDGTVFVHPSPWNGKERWSGSDGAQLAGIIYLKHGENKMEPIAPAQVAAQTFLSCFQTYESAEVLRCIASLTNHLLKAVPLWLLTNRGDYASSEMIFDVMKNNEETR